MSSYYAVAAGRQVGIFRTWAECQEMTKGFKGAKFKKFHTQKEAEEFITPSKQVVEHSPKYYIYTDGACSNNGKSNAKAGYGIWFGEGDSRNVSKGIIGDKQTNNVAELTAIIETFSIVKGDIESGVLITVVSDSNYAIRCVTDYGKTQAEKNWVKEIPNKDLVKKAYLLYADKPNVQFKWVAAHTDKADPHSLGNAEADRLANLAIGLESCPYAKN